MSFKNGKLINRRKSRDRRQRILKEIEKMIKLALKPSNSIELADRYIEIARRVSMKSRVRIPRNLKLFICRGCKKALIPGRTALFRIKRNKKTMIVITCLRCGHVYRRILGHTSEDALIKEAIDLSFS